MDWGDDKGWHTEELDEEEEEEELDDEDLDEEEEEKLVDGVDNDGVEVEDATGVLCVLFIDDGTEKGFWCCCLGEIC